LSWSLNIPGMVQLLRMPGLNMMSHNRFVFASAFAILAMACTGLDAVARSAVSWRSWFWWVAALLAVCCYWNLSWFVLPAEPIATELARQVKAGGKVEWVSTMADVQKVKAWFSGAYALALSLSMLTLGGWALVYAGRVRGRFIVPVLGVFAAGELLSFDCGRTVQCDPALYYPSLPVLDWLAKAKPGRVLGLGFCLPAQLTGVAGLSDVRGYDAVDPARYIELMDSVRLRTQKGSSYAQIQQFRPRTALVENGAVRLPSLLDLLGVRYVIFRKKATDENRVAAVFQDEGYCVFENPKAMPRAFVPQRVETVEVEEDRVAKLASDDFNPREVAYVEDPIELPGQCRGAAEITEENPARVVVRARMETPGLLVLTDRWEHNWHARADGAPAEILHANHAFRGVVLPAGTSTVEFYYDSPSFDLGVRLAAWGAAILGAWSVAVAGLRR